MEHPEIFPGLHADLAMYAREMLQASLPAPYFAKTGRRVWIEFAERYIDPDVYVAVAGRNGLSTDLSGGAVAAVASSVAAPVVVPVPPLVDDEHRELFVEIYAGDFDAKRLVTVIEILSPSNKKSGRHGRDRYLQKQHELLERDVHLIEVDLLRGGMHTTAVPEDGARTLAGSYDYHICMHQFDRPREFLVFPISLKSRLPTIPIPLLPGDAPVPIDLQAVFERCYALGAYHHEVDYVRGQPQPPLTADQQAWAAQVFAEKFPTRAAPKKQTGT